MEPHAFGAESRVDHVDVLALLDGLVRALGLAGSAIDAFLGDDRRHPVSLSRGYVARGRTQEHWSPSRLRRPRLPDPHRLGVGELADALSRQLAAVSGRLDAAEGQPRIALHHAIDEDLARLQLLDETVDLLRILRERSGAEAERRVVRQGDRLVEIARARNRRHGPEHLFYPHLRALGLEHHGGLEEE